MKDTKQMISYFLFATSALGVFTTVVDAHGYLASPRSRNYHASLVTLEGWKADYPTNTPWTEYDAPDLNQHGSTCGIKGDGRNYDHPLNIYGDPMPPVIQDCYGPEDEILLEVLLTAGHDGHFEYRACPISAGGVATQECFDDHPLEFVSDDLYNMPKDDNYPARAYIPHGKATYKHKYKLPPGLEGDLVLIQWIYVTANSCAVEGYDTYTFPPHSGPISVIQDCSEGWRDECSLEMNATLIGGCAEFLQPEMFWNCAEVKISNDCSSSAPEPAPVDTRWYVKHGVCLNDGQDTWNSDKYDTLGECCANGLGWIYDACMSAAAGSVESTGSPTTPSPSKSPTPQPSKAPITIGPSKSPTNSPVTPEPTITHPTTSDPSSGPSHSPPKNPTNAPITGTPTRLPTAMPSKSPSTDEPTNLPTSGAPTSGTIMYSGKFYVDWTKGIQGTNDQGKCVQDCDGDRPCGGKMETWETGYETEAVCCTTMPYKTYEQCTYKLIEPQPSTQAPTGGPPSPSPPSPGPGPGPGNYNYCGSDWIDANAKCGETCYHYSGGHKGTCSGAGQYCYGDAKNCPIVYEATSIEPQPSTPAPTPQPDTSWYPGDTNKCANDGNAPDWQHNKYLLQSQCCNSHFGWAYNNCMGIEQPASYEWYIDWTLIKCVMDCDVDDRDLCGGKVEGDWITLWSSADDCCSTHMPGYDFEECVIDHEAYQAGLQD